VLLFPLSAPAQELRLREPILRSQMALPGLVAREPPPEIRVTQ
jgi:hypothetical protein